MPELRAIPYETITDKLMQEEHDHMYKLIIIGSTGVGKSCLMKRIMSNDFQNEH